MSKGKLTNSDCEGHFCKRAKGQREIGNEQRAKGNKQLAIGNEQREMSK